MQTNSINVHVLNGIQTRQCRRFIFFVQGVPPVKDSFEFVFVTGDLWHLGNWQPHRAVKMSWQGGTKILCFLFDVFIHCFLFQEDFGVLKSTCR